MGDNLKYAVCDKTRQEKISQLKNDMEIKIKHKNDILQSKKFLEHNDRNDLDAKIEEFLIDYHLEKINNEIKNDSDEIERITRLGNLFMVILLSDLVIPFVAWVVSASVKPIHSFVLLAIIITALLSFDKFLLDIEEKINQNKKP